MPDATLEAILEAARKRWPDNHDGFQMYYEFGTGGPDDGKWQFCAMDCVADAEWFEADSLPALLAKLKGEEE